MIFFDNDVIHKLGCCDLLDETYALICPRHEIYVLDTAFYVLKKKTKKQGEVGAIYYVRVEKFLEKVKKLVDYNKDIITELAGIDDIDPGESLFISGLISHPNSSFLTGDKRCLVALAKSNFYDTYYAQLAGKAVCFEQILLFLLENIEFSQVKSKILPARACDKMLRSVFTDSAQKDSVVEGLNAYLNDLRKQTKQLLCRQFQGNMSPAILF